MAVEISFCTSDLLDLLKERVARETQDGDDVKCLGLPDTSNDVGPHDRDRAVRWLWHTHGEMHLHADTFITAVSHLDRLLNRVKINLKYLRCAALSCYWIAAKTQEEPQFVPTALQLIKTTHARFGPQDMTKMEKVIVKKLEWNLTHPTSYDFVDVYIALMWKDRGNAKLQELDPAMFLHQSITQLQQCLCYSNFINMKGSLLAMAIVSCLLEDSAIAWYQPLSSAQKACQTATKDLLAARQAIGSLAGSSNRPAPLLLGRRTANACQDRLSPIRENPFETEFASLHQSQKNSGACAFPSRSMSPTKRLVGHEDGNNYHQQEMNVDSQMDLSRNRLSYPASKKVKRFAP